MYLVGLYGYIPFHPSVNSILIFYPTTYHLKLTKILKINTYSGYDIAFDSIEN